MVYLAITVKYLHRRCAVSWLIGASRCIAVNLFFSAEAASSSRLGSMPGQTVLNVSALENRRSNRVVSTARSKLPENHEVRTTRGINRSVVDRRIGKDNVIRPYTAKEPSSFLSELTKLTEERKKPEIVAAL